MFKKILASISENKFTVCIIALLVIQTLYLANIQLELSEHSRHLRSMDWDITTIKSDIDDIKTNTKETADKLESFDTWGLKVKVSN